MRSKSLRAQIGILILATSLIQLANGFFGTFISLRVAIEDFGPTLSGLVPASHWARCVANGSSNGLGTSAPMPPSQEWSSPRPRPCRCWWGRSLG